MHDDGQNNHAFHNWTDLNFSEIIKSHPVRESINFEQQFYSKSVYDFLIRFG